MLFICSWFSGSRWFCCFRRAAWNVFAIWTHYRSSVCVYVFILQVCTSRVFVHLGNFVSHDSKESTEQKHNRGISVPTTESNTCWYQMLCTTDRYWFLYLFFFPVRWQFNCFHMDCQDVQHRYSWSPEDESQRLWWSPDVCPPHTQKKINWVKNWPSSCRWTGITVLVSFLDHHDWCCSRTITATNQSDGVLFMEGQKVHISSQLMWLYWLSVGILPRRFSIVNYRRTNSISYCPNLTKHFSVYVS